MWIQIVNAVTIILWLLFSTTKSACGFYFSVLSRFRHHYFSCTVSNCNP